jgi:hypothetical protein
VCNITTSLTLFVVPTSPPLNISLEALTPRSLLVGWQPPPATEQNGKLTNYTIIIQERAEDGEEDGSGYVREEMTEEEEFIVEGLQPFHLYSVSMAASTAVGVGPYSVELLIEMPEAGIAYSLVGLPLSQV